MRLLLIAICSFVLSYLMQYIAIGSINISILFLSFITLFSLSLFKIPRTILLIFGILLSVLIPDAILTKGLLKPSLLDVLLATDISETIQFHMSIPTTHLIIMVCSVFLFVFTIIYAFNYEQKKIRRKLILITLTPLLLITSSCYFMIFGGLVSDIIKEYKSLQVDNLPASSWLIKNKIIPKYNTYVVVIGESMRKDFMSLYGFSLDTTPFIDSIPKRYISNYITTAINTTLAVPRILSKTSDNGSVYEQDNIVELANMAGLNTFWISSQGYSGQYNIASSRISSYAKFKYFNKADDLGLLPVIKEKIKLKERKVIFVHIVGSHEYPCDRLFDYPIKYKTKSGRVVNCYLSTYNKTDDFIKDIYTYLEDSGESFSMVYFSDHGLNMIKDGNGYKVRRDASKKQSYQVPFFVASSDDKETTMADTTRSAKHFIDFFASWIGVKTNLTIDNYDIFSKENDNPMIMSYDKKLYQYNPIVNGLSSKDIMQ